MLSETLNRFNNTYHLQNICTYGNKNKLNELETKNPFSRIGFYHSNNKSTKFNSFSELIMTQKIFNTNNLYFDTIHLSDYLFVPNLTNYINLSIIITNEPNQWYSKLNNSLRVLMINKREHVETVVDDEFPNYDVLILNDKILQYFINCYALFNSTSYKRIIFDNFESLSIPTNFMLKSQFIWLLSADLLYAWYSIDNKTPFLFGNSYMRFYKEKQDEFDLYGFLQQPEQYLCNITYKQPIYTHISGFFYDLIKNIMSIHPSILELIVAEVELANPEFVFYEEHSNFYTIPIANLSEDEIIERLSIPKQKQIGEIDEKCCICYSNLSKPFVKTRCCRQHFHASCIIEACSTSYLSNNCPYCRAPNVPLIAVSPEYSDSWTKEMVIDDIIKQTDGIILFIWGLPQKRIIENSAAQNQKQIQIINNKIDSNATIFIINSIIKYKLFLKKKVETVVFLGTPNSYDIQLVNILNPTTIKIL